MSRQKLSSLAINTKCHGWLIQVKCFRSAIATLLQ
jgi:hypothetical protein